MTTMMAVAKNSVLDPAEIMSIEYADENHIENLPFRLINKIEVALTNEGALALIDMGGAVQIREVHGTWTLFAWIEVPELWKLPFSGIMSSLLEENQLVRIDVVTAALKINGKVVPSGVLYVGMVNLATM